MFSFKLYLVAIVCIHICIHDVHYAQIQTNMIQIKQTNEYLK